MADARAEIFAKVRAALAALKSGETPLPLCVDAEVVRQVDVAGVDEMWTLFAERIAALGDTAMRFDSMDELKRWLAGDLQSLGFTRGVGDEDALAVLGSGDRPLGSVEVKTSLNVDLLLRAEFGISMVDFAIAETGSIAIAAGAGRARLTSLAPEVHYALLPMERLVADLVDGMQVQGEKYLEVSAVVWITGSSRTADIEGILVRGAHGPRRLVVLGY